LVRSEGGRYRIDLLKVSRHGSAHNTSPEISKRIDCTRCCGFFKISSIAGAGSAPRRRT